MEKRHLGVVQGQCADLQPQAGPPDPAAPSSSRARGAFSSAHLPGPLLKAPPALVQWGLKCSVCSDFAGPELGHQEVTRGIFVLQHSSPL